MTDKPWFRRPLAWVALAALFSNAGIVVTGVTVRLTGSGLGCPTWPKCTDGSYVPTSAYGIHGVIEFSNRMLTFAVIAVPVIALLLTWFTKPRRQSLVVLSVALFGGIFLNALVGGLTVLTNLNPWVVSAHFLPSPILVVVAYAFWVRIREGDGPVEWLGPQWMRWLSWLLIGAAALTVVVGTVVTGSGPHAGDAKAIRNGLDPAIISLVHADSGILLVGLTIAALIAFAAAKAPRKATVAVAVLFAVELLQIAIGYTQYFLHLPIVLVALHVSGAIILWIAALRPLFALRRRLDAPDTAQLEQIESQAALPRT
ncbi:COX15/CtaA family protein [Fodinicola acaciae]|uniref:COX15/CtaA family protein n=1 Tax=Fodinicola acaciae TaxID=2681555 RepID=UPI001C9E98E8|nr:COX15/CtaA family protein [Fodinicola acaciae]